MPVSGFFQILICSTIPISKIVSGYSIVTSICSYEVAISLSKLSPLLIYPRIPITKSILIIQIKMDTTTFFFCKLTYHSYLSLFLFSISLLFILCQLLHIRFFFSFHRSISYNTRNVLTIILRKNKKEKLRKQFTHIAQNRKLCYTIKTKSKI